MKVLLAVSGGIDSMYMAIKAPELFPGASFAVAHCNFSLREEAGDDQAFVRSWAERNNMPFHTVKFDTSAYASEHGISIEMAARELRYNWFDSLCREFGYDGIAVAHNLNDSVETTVLNMLRGTGIRGMRGIIPSSRLFRPLLGTSREEITAWMTGHGYQWREDRTNGENIYKRNIVRNEVFPLFSKINPSFLNTIRNDQDHFRQVDEIAEDYFRSCNLDSSSVDLESLKKHRHWEYLLYRLTEGKLNPGEFDSLRSSISEGGPLNGKRFGPLVVSAGKLVTASIDEGDVCMVVEGPGTYCFKGRSIRVERICRKDLDTLRQDHGVLIFDAALMRFPFLLRTWMEGDWMNPLGLHGRKKLSDMFVDLKWGQPEKSAATVAVSPSLNCNSDGHVAALLCERIDDAVKIGPGCDSILRITFAEGNID